MPRSKVLRNALVIVYTLSLTYVAMHIDFKDYEKHIKVSFLGLKRMVKNEENHLTDNRSYCLDAVYQVQRGMWHYPCDVAAFVSALNDNLKVKVADDKYPDDLDILPIHMIRGCKHVFYNRIPKSGSQSLYEAFLILGDRYNYTVRKKARGMGRDPSRRMHKIDGYVDSVSALEEARLTAKHVYFTDFVRHPQLTQPMVMVNVMRDPLDQVVSIYSWKRWGDSTLAKDRKPHTKPDINTCLKKYGPYAEQCLSWEMTALPFLCEHHHPKGNCWKRSRPGLADVQRAKWHVSHTFLAVGITEDLSAFTQVLEILMPGIFCNLTETWLGKAEWAYETYKSVRRETLTQESRDMLMKSLAMNYELYNFVKQRFYYVFKSVKRHKDALLSKYDRIA